MPHLSNRSSTEQQFLTILMSSVERLQAVQSHIDIVPHCYQAQGKWQHRHGNDDQNRSCCSQD